MCRVQRERTCCSERSGCILWPCQGQNGNPGLLGHGKDAVIVLKDERRNLYQDVQGLWPTTAPQRGDYQGRDCQWWDHEGLVSWPQVQQPLRVVRSVESWQQYSQLDSQPHPHHSEWVWVTTLSSLQVRTARVVRLGHQRWDIENQGFNELVNGWHADHVYKHLDDTGLLAILGGRCHSDSAVPHRPLGLHPGYSGHRQSDAIPCPARKSLRDLCNPFLPGRGFDVQNRSHHEGPNRGRAPTPGRYRPATHQRCQRRKLCDQLP